MPVYPNPAGGEMTVANRAEAEAKGWTPSMGTFGIRSDPNAGGGGGGDQGGGAAPPPTGPVVTNPGANQQLLNAAQQAAYQAYLNSKLNLDTEDLAFRKAQDAFSRTIQEAALTGTYNGAPTQAAQQQQFTHGIEAANLTGVYNGAPTLAAQSEQNKTALGYLGLIGNLRGPADYGQYLRTIGSTPGGIRDLVASASGRYTPASGATTGVSPTPATLGSMLGDVAGASGATTYGDFANAAGDLVAPNQIAPAAWQSYTDTQKKMLMALYGTKGYVPQDVADLYAQSLPRYAGPAGQTGTVKL